MHKGYNYEIHDNEDFETGIQRILDNLHNKSAQLIIARSRQHTSVHRLRVNLKKIRGILRLLRYDLGNDTYNELNKSYRKLAREVGILRDYTSQIELIESLKGRIEDKQLKAMLSKVVGQIKQQRIIAYKQFLSNGQASKIQQSIFQMKNTIHELNISGNPELIILKGLAKVYSKASNAKKINGVWENHEIYHSWRKQVKYLMYHLTVLKKSWPDYFQVYISELKKLGSLLGKLHDLHLLNELIIEKKFINVDEIQSDKLIKVISNRQLQIIKKAETISERLFYEDSNSFAARIYTLWQNSKQ